MHQKETLTRSIVSFPNRVLSSAAARAKPKKRPERMRADSTLAQRGNILDRNQPRFQEKAALGQNGKGVENTDSSENVVNTARRSPIM